MHSPNVWGGRGAGNVCAVGGGLARHYTGVVCLAREGARVTVLRAPELKLAATPGAAKKMNERGRCVMSDVAAFFLPGWPQQVCLGGKGSLRRAG
eukprot:COSAG04_NODE_16199_length_507_cov_0.637255_1_plen_95_part_00